MNIKEKKGSGFTFVDYDRRAFWKAIEKAVTCFADKELWGELVHQAIAQDFSWSRSAGEHLRVYR